MGTVIVASLFFVLVSYAQVVGYGLDSPKRRSTIMETKPVEVVTATGDTDVDHAIATLVLAFAADPVACWTYDDRDHYLRRIPRLFRALGTSSFAASGTAHQRRPWRRALASPCCLL